QGHRVGTGPGRHCPVRDPGARLGALSLRTPAAVRRHHRGGRAADAPRRAPPAPDPPSPAPAGLIAHLAGRGGRQSLLGVTAVNGVSLALEAGHIYGLIGPNGSGKTTLFNCITGLERLDAGRVTFRDERIDHLRPSAIARRGIGRTFQVIRVFPELTALENLLVVTRGPRAEAERRGREMLQFVKLERLADEDAGNLSYGRQKLVEFVRVLMTDPTLILLDEPAAGVNRTLLNDLLAAVSRLRDEGRTILLVEHDMKVVMGLCETVVVLDHGEKIAEGPPGSIQADER